MPVDHKNWDVPPGDDGRYINKTFASAAKYIAQFK
jgi:hypothetical protein